MPATVDLLSRIGHIVPAVSAFTGQWAGASTLLADCIWTPDPVGHGRRMWPVRSGSVTSGLSRCCGSRLGYGQVRRAATLPVLTSGVWVFTGGDFGAVDSDTRCRSRLVCRLVAASFDVGCGSTGSCVWDGEGAVVFDGGGHSRPELTPACQAFRGTLAIHGDGDAM